MMSFVIVGLSNYHILKNIIQAISPEIFNSLGCLDLILRSGGGGGKHPPSAVPGAKSPVLLGLRLCLPFCLCEKGVLSN